MFVDGTIYTCNANQILSSNMSLKSTPGKSFIKEDLTNTVHNNYRECLIAYEYKHEHTENDL